MKTLLSLFFLTSISAFSEELPQDYKSLQKLRVTEIDKINARYVKALERLKTKYTQQGNLEVAVTIDKEIKSFKKRSDTPQIAHKEEVDNDLEKLSGSWENTIGWSFQVKGNKGELYINNRLWSSASISPAGKDFKVIWGRNGITEIIAFTKRNTFEIRDANNNPKSGNRHTFSKER